MSKIAFFLSGGPNNALPKKSLGGLQSKQGITDFINNLFNDVTQQKANNGGVDYRCFYIRNDGVQLDKLHLFVDKGLSGSIVSLGLSLTREVQALTINGFPDKYGSFQLQHILKQGILTKVQTTRQIYFDSNVANMSNRIAAILNSLEGVHGVKAAGSQSSSGYDFLIKFAPGRGQELLGITANDTGVGMSIMRVTAGGPINSTAPHIGESNNKPNGVQFYQEKVFVGTFYPGDYMPVWLKRKVKAGTPAIHPEKCSFELVGEPISASPQALDSKAHF